MDSTRKLAPLTRGLRNLARWARAEKGRETMLAEAAKIPQQSVNSYFNRVARCPLQRAELLCAHTGGDVPFVKNDWLTAAEIRALAPSAAA